MTHTKTLDNFLGRDVSYSAEKRKIYDMLLNDARSPFRGKTMAEIFVYAAVFGFKNKKREKLKKAKPQISAIAISKSHTALLLTIPIIDTNGIDVLFNSEETVSMIEEYANGGIGILGDELLGSAVRAQDPIIKMASDMRDLVSDQPAS